MHFGAVHKLTFYGSSRNRVLDDISFWTITDRGVGLPNVNLRPQLWEQRWG